MTTPTKQSITRCIRTLGHAATRRGCDASMVVGTALRLWCTTSFPALPNSSLPYSKALAAEPEVLAFVGILNQLDFLEATYWLSSAYAMLTKETYRKKLAMFFTPLPLTTGLLDDLAEQGVDFGYQSFLDPACGGAAFLVPIALRMRTAIQNQGLGARRLLEHVKEHLYGVDLDETLCELSRQFLRMALYDEIQKTGHIPNFQIHQANSLTQMEALIGKFDVVVCNPPYRKMTAQELEPLRDAYADVIAAQPNIYGLFIALCVRVVRIGGYAALVTPTSFLSGQYFGRLRKFLIRHTDIEHIGLVRDRAGVFIDVSQETALTILRRHIEEDRTQTHANISLVSGKGQYTRVGKCRLRNSTAVWPIPRSVDDVVLLKAATRSRFRLTDYGYRVRIGTYVWNRDKRPRFASLQEVRRANAHTAIPLLWSRDISAAGMARLENLGTLEGRMRFVDLGDKAHSAVVRAPSVVIQRVTSTDQSRRLVAAEVSPNVVTEYGGFVGENHVVIVEQIDDEPALPPNNLVSLLSTAAVDRYFRCISGATNVSAFELNQLALPDPQVIKEALMCTDSMDEAVNYAWKRALDDQQ